MELLTEAPYNLDVQDEVVAKVRAQNSRGFGPYSSDSTGGETLQTVPN